MSFLRIAGSDDACGLLLGRLQRRVLEERLGAMREQARRQGLEDVLAERVEAFRERLMAVAPHWLTEARGLAEGSGVDLRDILALNCLPPGFYQRRTVNNCTTFVSLGERRHALFKIRDTAPATQSFHIQEVSGRVPVQLGRAVGGLGAGHAVTARGLAGACNTGSYTDLVDDAPRLDDCHVLRLLLEQAPDVEAIPECYSRLVAADAVGGAGPGRGALYFFVDSRRALLLEAAGKHFEATFLEEGTHVLSNHFLTERGQRWWSRPPELNTRRRRERLEILLRRAVRPQPESREVFAMSRDRKHHPHSLCNDDRRHFWMTVSAQLQWVDREAPEQSVNWVCCGHTRQSLFVPVPLQEEMSYVPWVDGSFFAAAHDRYRRFRCRPSLGAAQKHFEAEALRLGAAAWRSLCAEAHALVKGR